MMCWESMSNFTEEEPHNEPENVVKKHIEKKEKLRYEEEHVKPTLHKRNQVKNLIEEFSWEREDDGSTLETEEPKQQQVVYITNLKNSLQKDCTKLYD